jgi:hypothetical protein
MKAKRQERLAPMKQKTIHKRLPGNIAASPKPLSKVFDAAEQDK